MNAETKHGGAVDVGNLKAIAASDSDTAKTSAILNAAREIERLRAAVAELIGAANQAKRAYWLARNCAAGFSNHCEESGSTRRFERELTEAESIYRASGFDAALVNIRSAS